MIRKIDVLRAINLGTTKASRDKNRTAPLAKRVSNPSNVERVRTVLHQLRGAGMVERNAALEWRLTDAGKDELAGLI